MCGLQLVWARQMELVIWYTMFSVIILQALGNNKKRVAYDTCCYMKWHKKFSNLNGTSNFNDIPNKMFSVKLKRAQTCSFQSLIGDSICQPSIESLTNLLVLNCSSKLKWLCSKWYVKGGGGGMILNKEKVFESSLTWGLWNKILNFVLLWNDLHEVA